MIRLSRLSKLYGSKEVVNEVSFDINPGDYIAIVGPSGSGKTTLLCMISGLLKPESGEVYFENHNLSSFSRSQWAAFRSQYFGLVFQFSELVSSLTVEENILLPGLFAGRLSPADYKKRARFLMERLGLEGLHRALPMDLSGGQTQLVAIARSLINEPAVLLADEPSGDLDPEHSSFVKSLFADFNKNGLSILLVTHDMKLAFDAKTVYRMRDGEFEDIISKKR